ncbi:MAG: GNAT family N-acetyltransferase [Candidatus Eisenbacteria bacterium]
MIILETEHLLFRHLVPDDLDDLFALYRDPEIRRYFPDGTRTLAETREELEWFRHGHPEHPELGLWATILKGEPGARGDDPGRFIGRCGLLPWTIDGVLEVEIAYMIAKPYWRRGLGSEAARALVRHGFQQLRLPRLIALVDPEHEASIRTAESAGLRRGRETVMDGLPTVIYQIDNPPAGR